MHEPLVQIARDLEIRMEFGEAARAEVRAFGANSGIDAPGLEDLTALPFVTIDGPTSKDLDQAIFVKRSGSSYGVWYALADAAHFVPTSGALFEESLLRGASYYFPGFSVPMLPRELSEGLISLNPRVDRRALVFVCHLDERAAVERTRVVRGRIRSRAKLTFGGVQELYDDPKHSPLAAEPYAESLELLREVGEKRLALAEGADVVRYRRREIEVKLASPEASSGKGPAAEAGFVVLEAARLGVEAYNEQISVLVNREGGRLLSESRDPRLQPIYRVHPAPDPEKLEALRALTRGLAAVHRLEAPRFVLHEGESLNAFLRRLPSRDATGEGTSRITRAIERQAVLVNMRSGFSTEAARHFGVGAEVYARFSAPMREVVGIFLHKEMLELLRLEPHAEDAVDAALRERVVEAANRGRELQRRVNDQTNRLVLDQLLSPDLAQRERPARRGTVMGITASKLHVELDTPGLDVKVYVRDLGKQLGGVWLDLVHDGAALVRRDTKEPICAVGDDVDVRVVSKDKGQDRWVLAVSRRGPQGLSIA
ncbi:MAG: RNB domain-containing ribonuclease [Polyangiaceae bacterium]|nr:RNB domain-containing ribonuclease [Polyangiaceae bacterium]